MDPDPALNVSEHSRLTKQQEYITTALNFIIHPTIFRTINSNSGPKNIAFISRTPLSSTVYSDLPHNLKWTSYQPETITSSSLQTTSVNPSEHAEGKFDIILINLIHTTLSTPSQWTTTLSNLNSLLKPGGYIQWIDFDPPSLRLAGSNPGKPDPRNVRELLRKFTDERKVGSTYRIPRVLSEGGFGDVDSDIYPIAPDLGFTRVVVGGILEELKDGDGGKGIDEKRIEEEIEESGPLVWYDLWCHVGRKKEEEEES